MMHVEIEHLGFFIPKFSGDTLILSIPPHPHALMRYMKQLETNTTHYIV